MKNTFKHLVVAAFFSAVLPAQAAVQNYSFTGVLDSGYYNGETYSGSFSFDDAIVDNTGLDIVNLISFDMSFLNTNFTLANAADYPTTLPDVSFQDGSFLGLSLSIDSVTPNAGFTFVAGSVDSSDAFLAVDTNLGLTGAGNVAYSLTAPVPEAETYAMLLAGLGVMGAAARRRKSA
jgi:PEP-CTERM motif